MGPYLVAGHISVHISRVDMIDDNVLPGVPRQLPLVDPAEGAPPDLGHHVGGVRPAVAGVGAGLWQ